MENASSFLRMLLVVGLLITAGCVGDDSEGPKTANVTFSEPSTGIAFNGFHYAGSSSMGGEVTYTTSRVQKGGRVDSVIVNEHDVYENVSEKTYKFTRESDGIIYENYTSVIFDVPSKNDDAQTHKYHIVAKNESEGEIDSINATVTAKECGFWCWWF